ncbi:MAG TPA: hypothetical protein VF041_07335 [Gemmatimonadaceae bacterium]
MSAGAPRARARVRATRLVLVASAVGAAVLWALAVWLLALALVGALDWLLSLPGGARVPLRAAALALGAVAAVVVLWRARRLHSTNAVALWIEERVPTLRYALVTAVDPASVGATSELERAVDGARWAAPVARAVARALAPPLGLLLAALATAALLPPAIVARLGTRAGADASGASASAPAARANRLGGLTVTITPPAYSGLDERTVRDPSSIAALPGSSVRVEGKGRAAGLDARLASERLDARESGARWHVIFAMPPRPAALRLRDGSAERVLVLAPRPDSAPVVTLVAPARDTVLRAAAGALSLVASATDDFGLESVWLEYIVSSGEGETFTFRSGVARRSRAALARSFTLRAALRLDSLRLRPGDIVHVRAVAVDGNSATGPDTGTSETRALRVARAGEYDSVAVEGAPPPDVDQSALSERMLIQLAEALERRRATLGRATLVRESGAIARDQRSLRTRVGDVIFTRLGRDTGAEESPDAAPRAPMTPERLLAAADSATAAGGGALDFGGDETPVVAANRPLLEAYDAMWAAERALNVGALRDALPSMYAALAAIQRARAAERLYLRGKPAAVVVDVARVRLAGKRDDAAAAPRLPRAPLDTSAAARTTRLARALALLARGASGAVDSLLLLRVDALDRDPRLAAALADAVEALRSGRDATEPLVRARRAGGASVTREPVGAWGGAW